MSQIIENYGDTVRDAWVLVGADRPMKAGERIALAAAVTPHVDIADHLLGWHEAGRLHGQRAFGRHHGGSARSTACWRLCSESSGL